MGVLLEILNSVEFLREADRDAVMRFMVLGRCVHHRSGHCFWLEGDPARALVIPVSGSLRCVARGPEGREFIDRFAGPGECAGLESLLTGMVHPTAAEVVRAGEFFVLRPEAFTRYVKEYPRTQGAMTRTLGMVLALQIREREDIALRSVPQRLARLLMEHSCVRQSDGAKVLLDVTQGDLASRLGTVREVVARALSRFAARGLVTRNKHGLFVEDWDGLKAEADVVDEPSNGGGTTPRLRTDRYFLPMAERGSGWDTDSTGCREHLGDLQECARLGCPNAEKAMRDAKSS